MIWVVGQGIALIRQMELSLWVESDAGGQGPGFLDEVFYRTSQYVICLAVGVGGGSASFFPIPIRENEINPIFLK